ncbi:helix-turn-helix domain-containing protein [Krasilnikovia sp. MM14-A1259]|uniref:helix-turn-helix domain-containing protein n=1 Tax=Krasilnikovia sp. MM14-A1259 TaxID=3373539 RepID=UPI00380084A7
MTSSHPLGAFLRARRARLQPQDIGLPGTIGRRRTAGLRREELAAVAGLSVDYYIRLEQGRERNPSPVVIAALAHALRLDADESHHLHRLADHAAGRRAERPPPRPAVSAPTMALLDRLRPWPALILARTGDVLACNPEGLALYAGLDEWPEPRRSIIRYIFTHPAARSVLANWQWSAATSVANLRHWTGTDPDAPDLRRIHHELAAASADFRQLWERQDVRPRRTTNKAFHHPRVGDIVLTHQSWHLDDSATRLSLYQPEPAHTDQVALLAHTLHTPRQPYPTRE